MIDIKTDLKHFIENNIELIDNQDYTELYRRWARENPRGSIRSNELTELLLECNINFMPFMSIIPRYCFCNLPIDNITIPQTISSIDEKAFTGCSKLKHIDFPTSISRIQSSAFEDSGLENVDLPDSVKMIAEKAFCNNASLKNAKVGTAYYLGAKVFANCSQLESVTIDEGITTIFVETFENCQSLEEVVLPSTLKLVYSSAFNNCSKKLVIQYRGTIESWNKIYKLTSNVRNYQKVICTNGVIQ